jgi:hypothetical protein
MRITNYDNVNNYKSIQFISRMEIWNFEHPLGKRKTRRRKDV